MDACSKIGPAPVIPDTGTLKGNVTALATGLAQQLKSARWAAVLPSIIDAAEREPELVQLLAQLHAGQMIPYVAVAERAKKRGELASGTNVPEFVASIVAPFFYRRWFTRQHPLSEKPALAWTLLKDGSRKFAGEQGLFRILKEADGAPTALAFVAAGCGWRS
jgi:Tetracyclin repressor-like, C-terminal domain